MKPSADIIKAKLDAGVLPVDRPVKLWVGDGTGQTCGVCEQPIVKPQTEYEALYDDQRPAVHFHVECHALWQAEVSRRARS